MKQTFFLFLTAVVVVLSGCGGKDNNGGDGAGYPGYNPGYMPPQGSGVTGNRFGATLSITNPGQFQRFLAYSRRCVNSGGFIYGSNRCNQYSSKGYIIINAPQQASDGTKVMVEITAGAESPNVPAGYPPGFGWVLPPITVPLNMTYQAINNNQGFVLYDGSQFNYPTGVINVRVNSGSITGDSFSLSLDYERQEFARTTVYRW